MLTGNWLSVRKIKKRDRLSIPAKRALYRGWEKKDTISVISSDNILFLRIYKIDLEILIYVQLKVNLKK